MIVLGNKFILIGILCAKRIGMICDCQGKTSRPLLRDQTSVFLCTLVGCIKHPGRILGVFFGSEFGTRVPFPPQNLDFLPWDLAQGAFLPRNQGRVNFYSFQQSVMFLRPKRYLKTKSLQHRLKTFKKTRLLR